MARHILNPRARKGLADTPTVEVIKGYGRVVYTGIPCRFCGQQYLWEADAGLLDCGELQSGLCAQAALAAHVGDFLEGNIDGSELQESYDRCKLEGEPIPTPAEVAAVVRDTDRAMHMMPLTNPRRRR
jgi:hypothetical protein